MKPLNEYEDEGGDEIVSTFFIFAGRVYSFKFFVVVTDVVKFIIFNLM